uniref:Uncharacterized protein n=1 Tax=Cacopsylla melanoneura TaxID=428564 RepID=A0A8D9AW81_9HEMI
MGFPSIHDTYRPKKVYFPTHKRVTNIFQLSVFQKSQHIFQEKTRSIFPNSRTFSGAFLRSPGKSVGIFGKPMVGKCSLGLCASYSRYIVCRYHEWLENT